MNRSTSVKRGATRRREVDGAYSAHQLPQVRRAGTQEGMTHEGESANGWPANHAPADNVPVDQVVFPSPPLVATVVVAPVPDTAPAQLSNLVDPVADDHGRVVDWELRRSQPYDAPDLKAFRAWRDTWERTWELGPLSNLPPLQRFAAGLADVPRVAALLGALVDRPETVRIEPSSVSDLSSQLEAVRAALAGQDREGAAIVDQTPRRRSTVGFSRTWPTPVVPELLAANRRTAVVVDPTDGLVVIDQLTGDRRITDVVETDLRGEVVVVTNRRGDTIELEAAAARPLAWIVPSSLRWKVRPIPEVVVWSSVFSRLPDALSVAAATNGVVSFTADRDS
jgi:hypothetical protein